MPDPHPAILAALKSCAANVGPLIGVDLEIGEITTETSAAIPEGDLAVLPLSLRIDEDQLAALTLSVPIDQLATLGRRLAGDEEPDKERLATLGRRLAGDEEPDKERELSGEDLGACKEVLTVMGGAIADSFREELGGLELEPGAWWSTEDPGDAVFPDGSHVCGKTTVDVPGGTAVELTLRLPHSVLEQTQGAQFAAARDEVLLAGLGTELVKTLQPILEAAGLNVALADPDAEDAAASYERTDVIVLSDDRDDALELLCRLRKAAPTWRTPLILCMSEPTRARVIRTMECGASHVLKLPTSEAELQKVLESVRKD